MPQITANNLQIEYESFGAAGGAGDPADHGPGRAIEALEHCRAL
jgi:hypothetical protein